MIESRSWTGTALLVVSVTTMFGCGGAVIAVMSPAQRESTCETGGRSRNGEPYPARIRVPACMKLANDAQDESKRQHYRAQACRVSREEHAPPPEGMSESDCLNAANAASSSGRKLEAGAVGQTAKPFESASPFATEANAGTETAANAERAERDKTKQRVASMGVEEARKLSKEGADGPDHQLLNDITNRFCFVTVSRGGDGEVCFNIGIMRSAAPRNPRFVMPPTWVADAFESSCKLGFAPACSRPEIARAAAYRQERNAEQERQAQQPPQAESGGSQDAEPRSRSDAASRRTASTAGTSPDEHFAGTCFIGKEERRTLTARTGTTVITITSNTELLCAIYTPSGKKLDDGKGKECVVTVAAQARVEGLTLWFQKDGGGQFTYKGTMQHTP